MKFNRIAIALGLGGLLVAAGLAVAQTYPPPQITTINNLKDLIQVVVAGRGQAQSVYATGSLITNAPGYVKVTPGTGSGCTAGTPVTGGCVGYYNTFANAQTYMIIIQTGTQTYSYNYTAAAPSDGARECIVGSGGAITQASLVATGSQTVTGGSNVSISSNSSACWTYSLTNTTWDRS